MWGSNQDPRAYCKIQLRSMAERSVSPLKCQPAGLLTEIKTVQNGRTQWAKWQALARFFASCDCPFFLQAFEKTAYRGIKTNSFEINSEICFH